MSSVRAATRVSISWDGDEPLEDTETLVLTINDFSLDLRVFVGGSQAGEIDWSTVAKVSETETSTAEKPSLRWDHIIDSRPPTDLPDQGVFDILPNGDVTETGVMFNPKTGSNQAYVETWRRYPEESGQPYCVLERIAVDGDKAFLGRVGSRSLGIAKTVSGLFGAWREIVEGDVAKRVYTKGYVKRIPSLTTGPREYKTGEIVRFGGEKWLVLTAGTL